jgi:hypothetical protein
MVIDCYLFGSFLSRRLLAAASDEKSAATSGAETGDSPHRTGTIAPVKPAALKPSFA